MSIRLRSRRGAIGTSEHAVALRENLERLLGPERIRRGRTPAREGWVEWLDVAPGVARADVRDELGEIRSARLDVAPLGSGDRGVLLEAARARADLPARLLAGELPAEFARELDEQEISLVPAASTDVWHDCSCLDWPGPCRHVAALVYVLVEAVDERPEHLLTLRGITLADLAPPRGRSARAVAPAPDDAPSAPVPEAESPLDDGGPAPGAFDARTADAGLLLSALGPEAAGVLARFYGARPPGAS